MTANADGRSWCGVPGCPCGGRPPFPLGRTVATRAAVAVLTAADMVAGMDRHASGDWGEVCQEDANANDRALVDGERLLSAYTSSDGVTFWIITEADRSMTTVLLPEDY